VKSRLWIHIKRSGSATLHLGGKILKGGRTEENLKKEERRKIRRKLKS
jgi:hypothetical protein